MYKRKTVDEYQIQGFYSGTWETVTTEETRQDAKKMLKCYNENESTIIHRIVKKRVKIENDNCPKCSSDNIANEGPEMEYTCHDCSNQWGEILEEVK